MIGCWDYIFQGYQYFDFLPASPKIIEKSRILCLFNRGQIICDINYQLADGDQNNNTCIDR